MNDHQPSQVARAAVVIGPVAVALVAWATESSKGDMAIANVALLLAALCVGAALLSWQAGIVTSVVAGLALNFFHTVPVHSLRMTEGAEILTVVLLIALGGVVSAATAWRVRRTAFARHDAEGDRATERLRELLAEGVPALTAWHTALDGANPQLGLLDARLVPEVPASMPLVARSSGSADAGTVVLPESGAAVRLAGDQRLLLVRPKQGMGAVEVDRTALLAFADQVVVTLANA